MRMIPFSVPCINPSDCLFDAIVKVNIHIARVLRHIGKLGLAVAETKTEAVLFCRSRPNVMPVIRVGKVDILVEDSMKYLGVIIDRLWNFREHFKYVESKITKVSKALSRLMPNLRGPSERRLYAMVVTSITMYAALVWGRELSSPDRFIMAFSSGTAHSYDPNYCGLQNRIVRRGYSFS